MNKRILYSCVPFVFSALLLSGAGFMFHRSGMSVEDAERLIRRTEAIRAADGMENPESALARYRNLDASDMPEIGLRILRRQWEILLLRMDEIKRARDNQQLSEHLPEMADAVKDIIDDAKHRADLLLSADPPMESAYSWRVFNLKGVLGLLEGVVILETEGNEKKAAAVLKTALSDFKSSIRIVDTLPVSSSERNIPRWNLELLYGRGAVRKLVMSETLPERRMNLKENLEAVIPEKGGYAPGDPIDRSIRK